MDGSQHFGVPTRHAGSDSALQGLEATEDGRSLEDSEQEAQHFQACANVPVVDLVRLLLEGEQGRTWMKRAGAVRYSQQNLKLCATKYLEVKNH